MISISNVTKSHKGSPRPALDNVSIEIDKGDFVFLVGASGSGKSTLLRLILREDVPSKGSIHVLGENLVAIPSRRVPHFRRTIGVVFQDFRLLPGKTVFQNVAFSLEVIGKSSAFIADAVPEVLKLVGLAEKADRLPGELSGGEQQRVALARAIVNKPAILLADEPTGNLDPNTSADIVNLLEKISQSGTTIVMATHDVGIVNRLKRRVIELKHGVIVRDDKKSGYETALPNTDQVQTIEPAGEEQA
ncbi:MAG: cell division ATP-binding protein FtsE [Rhodoluna sp.]